MSTFVLKVNADYCPGSVGIPAAPDTWERSQFLTVAPRSVINSSEAPRSPEIGDRVHIWINERGGGAGYTGYGTVVATLGHFSRRANPVYDFRLDNIRLLPEAIPGDAFWSYEDEAVSSLRRYTLRQLLWLTEDQAEGFEAVLQELITSRFGEDELHFLERSDTTDPEIAEALREYEPRIAAAFRERYVFDQIEQSGFRSRLLAEYDGSCCITGSRVEALLDAAYIVPPSSAFRFSEDVRNGLLLRSDIRRLFDAHLLGIDPATRSVTLADELAGSEYEEIDDLKLDVSADKNLLERRFAEFRQRRT